MLREKKNLIIVSNDRTKSTAEFLIQLIALKDDIGNTEVGTPDGSVNAAIWTEKHYNDNLATMGTQQFVLFIGESKTSKTIIQNIHTHYDKYTIKYGWLGNKGAIYISDNESISDEEYDNFLEEAEMERKKPKNIKGNDLGAIFDRTVRSLVNRASEKKQVTEQLYKFAVLYFYLNDLRTFLGV